MRFAHTAWVNSVALLPDGRRALSASDDRTLRLWDIETGAELDHYVGEAAFTALAAMPDGKHALTGNYIGRVVTVPITDRRQTAETFLQ